MFKKLKHQLSKTILNKKIRLVFLFLFALGLLFNASPAQALFGVGDFGIFDVAGIQLDALDFIDSTILQYIVFLLVLTVESIIFSALSASLLQWAINIPINLSSEIVVQGWNFIAGISNALLLLVLVFIALAYILRIETFEAKKALPKLILIALLINFSKVFVGVFVDIAQILQNSIAGALGGDFITLAMEPLKASGLNILAWLVGIITGYSIIALIPYGNVVALMVLLGLFITGPLFQILGKTILLIIFNFASGTIFLFFTGLFLIRIAMIWILTIFAPLAFVASILKTTKKHWDKWLHMLTEWTFLGIMVLFLLGLGLKLFGVIIDEPVHFSLDILEGNFEVPGFIYYYLFLLVYLGVVLVLSKQNMPGFAEALIGQAKTLGGRGGKMFGRTAVKGLRGVAVTQEDREKEAKAAKGIKGWVLRRGATATKWGAAQPVRWAYRAAGTTPEVAATKEISSSAEEFEKKFGKDVNSAINVHGGKIGFGRLAPERKAGLGLYLAKTKGEEGLDKLDNDQQRQVIKSIIARTPGKVTDLVKHKSGLIDDEEVGKSIQNAMVSKGMDDSDVKKLIDLGVVSVEDKEKVTEEEKEGAMKKAAYKKAVDSLKSNDIETLSKGTIDNANFHEMAARFKDWSFIRKLGEERGSEYIEKIQDKAEIIGIEKIDKTNSSFIRAPYSPGGELIMRKWKDEDGNDMERESVIELIKGVRKPSIEEEEEEEDIKTQKKIEEMQKLKKALIEKSKGTSPKEDTKGSPPPPPTTPPPPPPTTPPPPPLTTYPPKPKKPPVKKSPSVSSEKPPLKKAAQYPVILSEIHKKANKFREEIWKNTTKSERKERVEEAKGDLNKAEETFWATNYELTSVAAKNKIPLVALHDENHYVLVTRLDKDKDILKVYDPMSGHKDIPLEDVYKGIKEGRQHIILGGDDESPEFKEFFKEDKDIAEPLKRIFGKIKNLTIDSDSAKKRGDEWLEKNVKGVTAGANKFYDQDKIKSLEKIKQLQKDTWNCGPLSVAAAEAIMKKPKTTSEKTKT